MEDENASDPGFDEDGAVAAEAALLKAEALFHLGNFEIAAIWFHRHGRARAGADAVCKTDLQDMRVGVSKCKKAILNAFEKKTGATRTRRDSNGIFSFPQLPEFLNRMQAEHNGDISKILNIEGGEHREALLKSGSFLGPY